MNTTNFYTIKKNIPATNLYIGTNYANDASKDLDDLILSNLIKENSYMGTLFTTTPKYKKHCKLYNLLFGKKSSTPKATSFDLLSAMDFIIDYYNNSYGGNETQIKLSDGTIIRIFDDEIQIDDVLLSLEDSKKLLDILKPSTQKLIIDFAINIKI